ncbi:MAG: hypothetical protein ACI4UJ_01430 [Candidatus Cryptobacteroides sp.]
MKTSIKTAKRIITIAIAAVIGISCLGEESPAINIETPSYVVRNNGGHIQILYSVQNPVTGASVTASSSDSWIKDIDISHNGRIEFSIEANPYSEGRRGSITVNYTYRANAGEHKTVSAIATILQGS